MKLGDTITMPFIHANRNDSSSSSQKSAIKAQNSIYQDFNRRRNAVRIDRYFILLKSARIKKAISALALVLVITIFAIYIILTRQTFISFANNLKDTMLFSSAEQILSSLWFLIDEPSFFTSFLANFIKDSDIPLPSKETAFDYATILTNSFRASSANIYWWKFGLPSGSLIALFSEETTNYIKWYYAETTPDKLGTLYAYDTDESFQNLSYPFLPGDPEGPYNSTDRYWYEYALSTTHTTWTSLYFSTGFTEPVFSSVASVVSDLTNEVQFVVSLDLRLEYVQQYLKNMLPERESRLAITSSDGFVVAVAGIDEQIDDISTEGIITKTIDQLEDPIWQCVTKHPKFKSIENYTVECEFPTGSDSVDTSSYRIIRSTVVFSERTNWTIHIVLKADEVVQTGLSIYNNQFIISSLICFVVWIVISIIVFILKRYLRAEQTKLLLSKTKKKINHHVKQIGVLQCFTILRNILAAHENNENISNEMNLAVADILSEPENILFNKYEFARSFGNAQVREKILNIFGIKIDSDEFNSENPNHAEKDEDHSFINPIVFDDEYNLINNFKSNDIFNDKNIEKNIEKLNNKNDKNNKNEKGFERERLNDDRSYFIHTNQVNFVEHKAIINMDYNEIINHTLRIGKLMNEAHSVFEENEFERIILEELNRIPQNLFKYCGDSIDLLNLLCTFRVNLMLSDKDMILAMYLALISFHVSMSDRMNDNLPPIRKYFLINIDRIFDVSSDLLERLKPYSIDSTRFKNIEYYVELLVETTPISKHIEIYDRCKLFIPSIFQDQQLKFESIDLIRFTYNVSSVSLLVGSNEFINSNHEALLSKYRGKRDIEGFKNCMKNVYLSKMHATIKQIFGSKFSRSIISVK